MLDKSQILTLAQPIAQGADLFVVDIKVSPANDIEITIDANRRLTLDECATFSKQIQPLIDLIDPDFSLTVFSAGIGSPLTDHRQFAKIIGQTVEIVFKGGQKFAAKLLQADVKPDMTGNITVQYAVKELVEGKKRKEMVDKTEVIPLTDIKSITEQLDIK